MLYYNGIMNETKQRELQKEEQKALQELALAFAISRIKTNGYFFDREYTWDDDTNQLGLTSEKAVIRVLGKIVKVPIGEDKEHKTFESAHEATRTYWSNYYAEVRLKRRGARTSESERVNQRRRQANYRAKLKDKEREIAQNQ